MRERVERKDEWPQEGVGRRSADCVPTGRAPFWAVSTLTLSLSHPGERTRARLGPGAADGPVATRS
jgi:hypothetical protein